PLIGSAFQTNSVGGVRTELVMLITPYVIRSDEDMADMADSLSSDINAAFRTGRGWSYTLTPFSVGYGVRGVGFDLPSPNRASERRQGPTASATSSGPVEDGLEEAPEPAED